MPPRGKVFPQLFQFYCMVIIGPALAEARSVIIIPFAISLKGTFHPFYPTRTPFLKSHYFPSRGVSPVYPTRMSFAKESLCPLKGAFGTSHPTRR